MKENKGVTLIELIISMVIFAVVIAGVAVFNASNTKATIKSERNAKRIILQEKTLEEFKGWLKSASVPGSRFDGIWTDNAVGDILFVRADSAVGISVKIRIDSFVPDQSANVYDAGVRLGLSLISEDLAYGVSDTIATLISRHD